MICTQDQESSSWVHRKFAILCLKEKEKEKEVNIFCILQLITSFFKELMLNFLHILLMQISCPTMTQDLANIIS